MNALIFTLLALSAFMAWFGSAFAKAVRSIEREEAIIDENEFGV